MARMGLFLVIAIIAVVLFLIKLIIGKLIRNKDLQSTTVKNETKKVMDSTAKGISWMETQWEQSRKDAGIVDEKSSDEK